MTLSRQAWLAAILWMVLAFLAWNVVFDRILVLAGRRYSYAATIATRETGTYVRIDDWMRPAIARGVTTASFTSAGIALFGISAVVFAARREKRPGQG